MPKRSTAFAAGQYYHIFNRGALQAPLFFDDKAYSLFTDLMYLYAKQFCVTVIAFCLMPNHFHVLIRVEENGAVDEWVKRTCHSFSKRLNLRFHRTGTCFQSRFQSRHIDSEQYLHQVCRYIHANPTQAGLVGCPDDWEYTDYHEWIGTRNRYNHDSEFVQSRYSRPEEYIEFVSSLIGERTLRSRDFSEGLQQMHLLMDN